MNTQLSGILELGEFDLIKMMVRDDQYIPHHQFDGVGICQLDQKNLPSSVSEIISRFKGESLQVFSVIIDNPVGIPEHQHSDDCEMYFGGNPFTTMFIHNPGENREEIQMNGRNYSIVMPGGKHGVITDITTRILAVKFKTSVSLPLQ